MENHTDLFLHLIEREMPEIIRFVGRVAVGNVARKELSDRKPRSAFPRFRVCGRNVNGIF